MQHTEVKPKHKISNSKYHLEDLYFELRFAITALILMNLSRFQSQFTSALTANNPRKLECTDRENDKSQMHTLRTNMSTEKFTFLPIINFTAFQFVVEGSWEE